MAKQTDKPDQALLGVIEGFYGKPWSWAMRHYCISTMSTMGLNSYIYAPKGDAFLRKCWREDWPMEEWQALLAMSEHCAEHRVQWGVGFSPYALYSDYTQQQRAELATKIHRLNQLNPDILAILFDDMPGDQADLAQRQYDIVADIAEHATARKIIVCPTYYSYDPVLSRYFGNMPVDYWSDLGRLLPLDIDFFWTGNEVCSKAISAEDVESISRAMGRPPVLWDNYPVNDGEKACNYLNLKPIKDRTIQLGSDIRGHLCNPMNQPWLSLAPLASLASLHKPSDDSMEKMFAEYLGDELGQLLYQDVSLFQETGLQGMTEPQKQQLIAKYNTITSPAAQEVVAWLKGDYQFDPAV